MEIGNRLRTLREGKHFSQGDIEKATGLLRCYVSRVENGHTVPSVDTLEKWARALEMPLYKLMYEGEEPPKPHKLAMEDDKGLWGHAKKDATELARLQRNLSKMTEKQRTLLLGFAARLVRYSSK
ncbi:MAG TPA: helix-turn-helix transcriptional regulator [Candidatus Acidoferrum sp.]|nr:helix-turn-helix transcriptional regulator [Candidatus Acidoferrum sp.]